MAVPTQSEMFGVVLRVMGDDIDRGWRDVQNDVAREVGLTQEEMEQSTPSGVPTYKSRTDWSVSHLYRAGLVNRISRGIYRISAEGLAFLAEKPSDLEVYRKTCGLIKQRNPRNTTKNRVESKIDERQDEEEIKSPQEMIEDSIEEINSSLADELLDTILDKDPRFFEALIVDLLVKMGYGQGRATQYVSDSGIDGIITTDALGFDPIYTQAKRYAKDHRVGRPELQAFAGALGNVARGVFITTSSFNSSAVDFASRYPHATIVLIDGQKLSELMIKYDLGVTIERSFQVKRLDIDYFEQA